MSALSLAMVGYVLALFLLLAVVVGTI